MASTGQNYPAHLNPFGDDVDDDEEVAEENHQTSSIKPTIKPVPKKICNDDDYPDHLSPFGPDEQADDDLDATIEDDYDESLNPFSRESDQEIDNLTQHHDDESNDVNSPDHCEQEPREEDQKKPDATNSERGPPLATNESNPSDAISTASKEIPAIHAEQSPESPPVPLPRTKSLFKKEQALRDRQQSVEPSAIKSQKSMAPPLPRSLPNAPNVESDTFQKKKNKRSAPPVPVDYKRQVSGSIEEFEAELNEIGDELLKLDEESKLCQDNIKAAHGKDEVEFEKNTSKLGEHIKRKNSIVRRQRELMYRKRELQLDQEHSDIEYELRMIGNKQLSNRTADDDSREKELLKRLVEIFEEKNDIVENLNKDTSCDAQSELEDALRRLDIKIERTVSPSLDDIVKPSIPTTKSQNCDKISLAMSTKLSKIATLLPKGGTIKGSMKIKRKKLFKKNDSRASD